MTQELDLNTLRKVAEAEPSNKWGAWEWEPSDWDDEHAVFIDDGHPGRSFVAEKISQGTDGGGATARFIATFDPPTVLALLARLEQAERSREQYVAHYEAATLALHRVWDLIPDDPDIRKMFVINAEDVSRALVGEPNE